MGRLTARGAPSRGPRWRRWNIVLHRDVGYVCVALTIIYAVSGIAVNHIHQWNPNYKIERVERRIEPIPAGDRAAMVAAAVERLGLKEAPKESFRPNPTTLQLFYDGWSVEIDTTAGKAIVERPRDRLFLRDFNFLHLNHPKGIWTLVADLYAASLFLLAVTGVFMLRGRKGIGGRGKWLVAAGLAVPLLFVLLLRYLG